MVNFGSQIFAARIQLALIARLVYANGHANRDRERHGSVVEAPPPQQQRFGLELGQRFIKKL